MKRLLFALLMVAPLAVFGLPEDPAPAKPPKISRKAKAAAAAKEAADKAAAADPHSADGADRPEDHSSAADPGAKAGDPSAKTGDPAAKAGDPAAKPGDPAMKASDAPSTEPGIDPAANVKPEKEPTAPAALPELPPLPKQENPETPLPNANKLPRDGEPSLVPNGSVLPPKPTKNDNRRGPTVLRPPTTSADLDARIRYRQAVTKVVVDPALQAMWGEARQVKTDYDKREVMKNYYTLLFKKVLAVDPGIAPFVVERRRLTLRRLTQARIDPTLPLGEEEGEHSVQIGE